MVKSDTAEDKFLEQHIHKSIQKSESLLISGQVEYNCIKCEKEVSQ